MPATDTVIVGAGPYGLSIAAWLSQAGVPHQILGKPMHAWRDFMPPGMLMRSEAFASSLHAPQPGYTVADYCRLRGIPYQPVGMHFPLESFVDYALWFQKNLVNHVRNVEVLALHRADGVYHLSLSDGSSLTARCVVLALGLKGFATMPPELQGLPSEFASHSAIYGDLAWSRNKQIVIVGGGQSALGLAALMHEAGAYVRVLVRDPVVTWNSDPVVSRSLVSRLLAPEGGLGPGWKSHILSEYPFVFRALSPQHRKRIVETSWGPSGAWWLRDRVKGKIEIGFGSEVRHAAVESDQVVLRVASGGTESTLRADHVIAATGFRPDLRKHAFIAEPLLDAMSLNNGIPDLSADFETGARGLYVVGPATAYSFGPAMRFVYGAKYAAPRVARHIGKSLPKDAKKERGVPRPGSSGDTVAN